MLAARAQHDCPGTCLLIQPGVAVGQRGDERAIEEVVRRPADLRDRNQVIADPHADVADAGRLAWRASLAAALLLPWRRNDRHQRTVTTRSRSGARGITGVISERVQVWGRGRAGLARPRTW